MANGLQNNRHAYVPAAHGGDENRESWYFSNVRELIEHAMQRNIKRTVLVVVCPVQVRFKQALVEDGCQISECLIGIADNNVDDCWRVSYTIELHGIIVQNGFNSAGV